MSKSLFFVFVKGIFLKAKNIFSIVSFLILIFTFFLQIPIALKSTIQVIALVSAFFFSSYSLWKESYKGSISRGELVFNLSNSIMVNLNWRDGLPTNPAIYFYFDIRNTDSEKFILNAINCLDKKKFAPLKINKNYNSLDLINSSLANHMEKVSLPLVIPERDYKVLRIMYSCKFKDYSDDTLKAFLSYDLYDFEFEFMFSNIENKDFKKRKNFKLIKNSLKKELINQLKTVGRTDILNSENS